MGIRVENVTKTYGRKVVLDNLYLEIPSKSFTCILAPTGSGKTTLLRIIAGIEKPDSGRIFYNDADVTDLPVQRRKISMVYQQFINYPSLSVYENIASPLRVSKEKYSEKEIERKVKEVSELLRISHVLTHLPEELSGGEQQRTAIARALIKNPEFIFFDEPLANLDYKLREELRSELKTVFKGTVIYATPEPVDVLTLATHVGYLYDGKIIQFGETEEVYNKPMFTGVAHYFNDPPMNILEAKLIRSEKDTFLQLSEELLISIKSFDKYLDEESYIVGVRPQNLSIIKNERSITTFEAEVSYVEMVGPVTTLHVSHFGTDIGVVIYQHKKPFRYGEKVKIYLEPSKIFLFSKKTKKLILAQGKIIS